MYEVRPEPRVVAMHAWTGGMGSGGSLLGPRKPSKTTVLRLSGLGNVNATC